MLVVGEKCPVCGGLQHDVVEDGFIRETGILWYKLLCQKCNHSWVMERRKEG